MTKMELWNLFKLTGKIEYYLEYKRSDNYEYREGRGDSSF